MCLGRHPRTGSTAILFSGIQFFLYATLQAEAMVIHSFMGLKLQISLNFDWNFIQPCFSSLTGVRSASRMISTFTNLSSMTSSNSLAKKQKNYTFHFVIYHKHTCKKKYNLNFPVHNTLAAIPPSEILSNPARSNSTIGNPDESSSVSSEKHHVYCFPSVPLIIKIKGYKPKTDR